MTNITVGKYYPSLFTQFIIGCILYIFSFFMITDIISSDSYQKYKYYIFILIIVDAAFLIYLAKYYKTTINNSNTENKTDQAIVQENTTTDNTSQKPNSNSLYSPSLSSEINDIKITHDISSSDLDNYNLFSTSDEEKKDIIVPEKVNSDDGEKSISISSISLEN